MPINKTVALLFPPRVSFFESVAEGIVQYASRNGGWRLVLWPERFGVSTASLADWKGDGAIGLSDTIDDAKTANSLRIPFVNLSGAVQNSGLYSVTVDNEAVGIMSAEHLLERGFQRFAYYGISDLCYSQLRGGAFRRRVEDAGCDCQCFWVGEIVDQRPWSHEESELCDWLASLKPPLGLMACNDYCARMLAESCRQAGLDVPGDAAIIGVDNESMICELSEPTLTSVSRDDLKIGYEAAALLDRLMANDAPREKNILIQPNGIVQRQSTDTVCADDVHLAAAVRFIRANISKPFDVKQLVANLPVSRRYLENGFRRIWGVSPRRYIVNLRIERAKKILACERKKIESVARACGFNNTLQFRRVFRRATGMSPREYRREAK